MKKNLWIFIGIIMTIGSATAYWNHSDFFDINLQSDKSSSVNIHEVMKENVDHSSKNRAATKRGEWQVNFTPQKVFIENQGQFKADPALKLDDQIKFG